MWYSFLKATVTYFCGLVAVWPLARSVSAALVGHEWKRVRTWKIKCCSPIDSVVYLATQVPYTGIKLDVSLFDESAETTITRTRTTNCYCIGNSVNITPSILNIYQKTVQ